MAVLLYDLCGRNPDLRFSPYCWRAKMAVAHKELAFESAPTPFTAIATAADGLSRTVPVIDDGGRIVADSFDIALYLETAYPDGPPLFAGEASIAAARFLQAWAFQALHGTIVRMILCEIHDILGDADQTYFRRSREARFGSTLEEHQTGVEANAEALQTALEPLRRVLARHAWLGGAQPAFCDYIPFGTLMWLRTIHGRLPLAPDDDVLSWFERCLDLHGGLARSAPQARLA
jgi:glutathione S-transferase